MLVVCGTTHVSFWPWGRLGEAIAYYGLVSGASGGYGFFAPSIGTGLRARFDVYDRAGRLALTDSLETGQNRESALRTYDIVEALSDELDNPTSRRMLGGSWAGKMFSRHPAASRVVVRVETLDIPTMAEFRSGTRYGWEPLYRAEYTRKAAGRGR